MARGDLTDEQWSQVEPHLPIAAVGPIPDLRKHSRGDVAVLHWRPWRDLPDEFGPWQSAYDRFRIWAGQGIFQDLMEAMIAEAQISLGALHRAWPAAGTPSRSRTRLSKTLL